MLKNIDLQEAYSMMQAASGILFVSHLRPDADALSSLSAMRLIAERIGKKTVAFAKEQHPTVFNYLPGFNSILDSLVKLKEKYGAASTWKNYFDLIVVTDCGSLARTALSEEILEFRASGGRVIELDHHPKIDDYADLELRDPNLSSTAEIVYNFIIANKITFDRILADCVLTGIMSDTGNFLYPSASQATMKASSAALAAGARYAKILQSVSGDKSLAVMKLWGLVLDRIQLNVEYKIAIALVTRQDIKKFFSEKLLEPALESEIFSDLIAFLSNYAGVKAVMLLHEDTKGYVKGSLRSTVDGYLVDGLARALGGGGHERAAGFAVPGRLKKINDSWQVVEV